MKAPRATEGSGTEQTPQAMLMPDQGTTPMRRRTERRTQADERCFDGGLVARGDLLSPSRACLVRSRARGKKCVRKGARGVESMVAQSEPMVVRAVRRMVAYAGEKSAPARTFCKMTMSGGGTKLASTHPDDAAWYRPGVFPDRRDGHDADYVCYWGRAALGVRVEFPAELREVRDRAWPRHGHGERREAVENEGGREGKEHEDDENGRMNLGWV